MWLSLLSEYVDSVQLAPREVSDLQSTLAELGLSSVGTLVFLKSFKHEFLGLFVGGKSIYFGGV